MVYFVQEKGRGGRIKIGHSSDVSGRVKALQAANPRRLEVLLVVEGTVQTERGFQRLFARWRCEGGREWFRPAAEIMAMVEELKQAGLALPSPAC